MANQHGQGIWTSLTCMREATLVAQKYKAQWLKTQIPVPSYLRSQITRESMAMYVILMSEKELGL